MILRMVKNGRKEGLNEIIVYNISRDIQMMKNHLFLIGGERHKKLSKKENVF